METDTSSSGRFGNKNYQNGNRTHGYTELSREVAPPPKNIIKKLWMIFHNYLSISSKIFCNFKQNGLI